MWNNVGFYLVVGLGALMLLAVIADNVLGSNASKAQTAAQNVTTVIGKIDSAYSGYPQGFTNISTASLVEGKYFPSTMIQSNKSGAGTAVNQWGGQVTVAPGSSSTEFVLTDPGLPTPACEAVAKLGDSNVVSIAVNGTSLQVPVDPAAAAGACNKSGNGTSGGNSVAITAN